MPGVRLENVGRRFGPVIAVDRLDLDIAHGEFVTLLGPSGCGKTTTLRMVAGLEQNTSGRIGIGDRVVSDAAAGFFVAPERRQLGMVFQSYAIWPHMTVFDNVAYPLRIRRRSKAEVRQRVEAVLRLVEMEAFAARPAPALSGGQQQRVAIARALVFEPQVLLLDEPLSNLDAQLRTQMGDEFRKLQKRLGITTLYVTHDQEEAMALSDRIVVMQAGRILQAGVPEEIYQRPASRAVAAFFGSPNLLPAKVAACAPDRNGYFGLEVDGRGWRGRCLAGEKFGVGETVLAILRPENIRLEAPDAGAGSAQIALPGRVVDTVYRGSRRSLTIETEGRQRLMAEIPSTKAVGIGEAVTAVADAGGVWAVRPEDPAADAIDRASAPMSPCADPGLP